MKKAGYRFSFFLVSHWRRFNAVEISGVTFELLQTHEQPLFIVQLSLSFPLFLSLSLFLVARFSLLGVIIRAASVATNNVPSVE